jgi:hypothetical protein
MSAPTVTYAALGLPLDTSDEDYDIAQPVEALVIVKGLDSRGKLCHWTLKTPDLTSVEAMGMAMWGYEVAAKS